MSSKWFIRPKCILHSVKYLEKNKPFGIVSCVHLRQGRVELNWKYDASFYYSKIENFLHACKFLLFLSSLRKYDEKLTMWEITEWNWSESISSKGILFLAGREKKFGCTVCLIKIWFSSSCSATLCFALEVV